MGVCEIMSMIRGNFPKIKKEDLSKDEDPRYIPCLGLVKMWREATITADYDTWGLWVD